jgi:hypothetical protein
LMQLLKSEVFLSAHCLWSSSVYPPAGGQYISFARLSFAQRFRQSDFSSAKHMQFKGHMIRSNRVMKNIRTMNSLTPFFFLFLYAHSCRMNLAKLQRQLLSIVFYCVWQ